MKNCLSQLKFANLIFLNLRIQDYETVALFDTGAVKTVISQSLFEKLSVKTTGSLNAGNNNGAIRKLRVANVSDVQIGDVFLNKLETVVTDDEDFILYDDNEHLFPAQILLGWDVISLFSWNYSAKNDCLTVNVSNRKPILSNSNAKQGQIPIVYPKYSGRRFKAAVDTGHTDSVLSIAWQNRLPKIDFRETEIIGIGSTKRTTTPYVKNFEITFQNHSICLHHLDICEKIYGRAADVEALFGFDFLEKRDWQLDLDFKLL